jgi:hypothetical protein
MEDSMEGSMVQAGDMIPHFSVTTLDGERVEYSTIWQRKNLVLISLPSESEESSTSYVADLAAHLPALVARNARCVLTRDAVPGLPRPGGVVADRWGEIAHVTSGPHVADLPLAHDIIEWLDYVQHQCPECQGETK